MFQDFSTEQIQTNSEATISRLGKIAWDYFGPVETGVERYVNYLNFMTTAPQLCIALEQKKQELIYEALAQANPEDALGLVLSSLFQIFEIYQETVKVDFEIIAQYLVEMTLEVLSKTYPRYMKKIRLQVQSPFIDLPDMET